MTNTLAGPIKAWAPSSSPPKAASLFCGAGGACLGLRQAGYDVIAGVDFDPLALTTYAAAGGHAVQHMITEEAPVPPEWVELMTGLDLLWASPPCQPWSRAGKMKGAEDERDAWPATIAAVALLKPRWFVAENVRGVERHLDSYVVPALRRMGYVVHQRLLNAADYGVPQYRRRWLVVAGSANYQWPVSTHGDPAMLRPLFDSRAPWVSMGDALGIWPPTEEEIWDLAGHLTPDMDIDDDDSDAWPLRREGIALDLLHQARHGVMPVKRGPWGLQPWRLSRPSPCVAATDLHGAGARSRRCIRDNVEPVHGLDRASDAMILATGRAKLTTAECAILQDFPADYPWQGGVTAVYRQIGNAVPPTLSRVVALAIKNHLARDPNQEPH